MPRLPLTLALLGVYLLCSALPAVAQETYILSPRLGPTVDAEERAYFGFFPDVVAFRDARAEAVGDSVRFVLQTSAADSVLTVSRATAEALGRFAETFELSTTAFYNPNWQLIKDYVRADVPVPYAGDDKGATLFADGGRYIGRPTYVSDSLVLLNHRGTAFDWATFDARGTVLRADEIDRVLLVPGWLGRPYVALAGAPVGIGINEALMSLTPNADRNLLERRIFAAALGVVAAKAFSIVYARTKPYDRARPALQDAGWFTPERQPLEMPPEAALRDQVAQRPAPDPIWQETYGWMSLGTGGISFSDNSQTYNYFSNFEPEAGTVEREVRYEGNGALLEAAAALQPLAWLDLGVGVYLASNQTLDDTDLQEVANSQPFVRLFADFDVVRLINADSRIGLSLGGGLIRSESRVEFSVPPVTGQSGTVFTYTPDGYEVEEAGFGPFYQAILSVGLARETSLYVSLQAYSPPSVDVPLFEAAPDINPAVTVFRVEPHTVDFSFVGVSAGARLSF